jgi:hypothetical protein
MEKIWLKQGSGAFLRRNWSLGAYLQKTRGWNIIMLINIGVYMQRVIKRASSEGI